MLGLRLGDRRRHSLRGQAAPDGGQLRQDRTVAIALRECGVGNILKPVRAGKETIEIVEAPIFRVDHDDVLDLLKFSTRLGRSLGRTRRDRAASASNDQNCR